MPESLARKSFDVSSRCRKNSSRMKAMYIINTMNAMNIVHIASIFSEGFECSETCRTPTPPQGQTWAFMAHSRPPIASSRHSLFCEF